MVFKVDYCASVLAGISGSVQNRLQMVLNAAARLVMFSQEVTTHHPNASGTSLVPCSSSGYDILVYRCVEGTAPVYIADSLQLTDDASARPVCHLRPKLHYTDTGYGHVVQRHQRTTLFVTSQHLDMSTCPDVGLWHCDVANLLYKKL